jgi:hypothetical protein
VLLPLRRLKKYKAANEGKIGSQEIEKWLLEQLGKEESCTILTKIDSAAASSTSNLEHKVTSMPIISG